MFYTRVLAAIRSTKGNTIPEFATLIALFAIAFSSPITDVRKDLEESFLQAASAMEGEAIVMAVTNPDGSTGENGDDGAQQRRGHGDPQHSTEGGGSDSTHIDIDGQCGPGVPAEFCERGVDAPVVLPPEVEGNGEGVAGQGAEPGIEESARAPQGPTYF